MSVQKEVKKITTNTLQRMKSNGEKISMITAYDFSSLKFLIPLVLTLFLLVTLLLM